MVRFRERSGTRRRWSVLIGLCTSAWLVLWWVDDFRWVFATLLVGMFGGIAALTLWSMDRYGAITLTDDELRVGRERVAVGDIIPASLASPGEGTSPPGKLLGGAQAPALGLHTVRFFRRDGSAAGVATRDPEAFVEALRSVLAR